MDVLGQDKREGLGRRANSRFVLLLLLLVSSILLLSSLYGAEASVFKKARETVVDAAEPVLRVFSGPIAFVQDVLGDIEDYFGVLEENKALREENAELRQWMNEALELRRTVAAYEQLQTYTPPPEAQPIDAYVIGESNDAFARSMIINAGRRDGVERDFAVVDDRGLVGHIVEAGASSARVLLLTDIQSRVPVYLEDAEIDGILVGRSRGRPIISFTSNSETVEINLGQRVLTSGAGGSLPRGLPVGTVRSERGGNAIVDLYANYTRTRLVRVMNYEFAPAVETPFDALDGDGASQGADEQSDNQQSGNEQSDIEQENTTVDSGQG